MKTSFLFALLIACILIGCGEKQTPPVPVGTMNNYRDPAFGFQIQYPSDWRQFGTAGKAVFAKSQDVLDKFLDPRSGLPGAQVTVEVLQTSGKNAADVIQSAKDDMKQANYQLEPDTSMTVDGKPATKVAYMIRATTKTNIYGHQIFVQGDTAMYRLDFEGYGDQYQAHRAVFDAMLKSFKLPVIVAQKANTWTPSPNLETYNTQWFTLQYPENMEMVQMPKGNKDLVWSVRADRYDCSFVIEVFGAKGLTVDKVWDQNKRAYKAKATGQTMVAGDKAYWVDYSPRKDIESRAYFMVKNDKVIRVTINYFAPQKDVYFPPFEKMVNSIKLK